MTTLATTPSNNHTARMTLLEALGVTLPIVQAPMAGISTPALAAMVSNAGGLGSIAVGATDAAGARAMIAETRALTSRPFNVNLFVHARPRRDPACERSWLDALAPLFAQYETEPPPELQVIYTSFADDDAMLATMVALAPAVVSFHFGLPGADRIAALKNAGCVLLATATSLTEAQAAKAAGVDGVIAQGWEAGGHRGMFDPDAPDDRLATVDLTRLLVRHAGLPIIAAGGIMDGPDIRAALDLSAIAAQLGTAFVACPESSADPAYRVALIGAYDGETAMTRAISGRPARCLDNAFTRCGETVPVQPPDYPLTYHAGKALNAAAKREGEAGFGAWWAGTGAPRCRAMPAADLMVLLARELADT